MATNKMSALKLLTLRDNEQIYSMSGGDEENNQSKAPREDGEAAVVRRCQERPQRLSRDLKEGRE